MRLIDKLNLVVFIGTTLDNGPNGENIRNEVLLIAIGVGSFLVLLFDLGCESESLFNNVFTGKFSATVFLVLVNALIVGFLVSIVFLFKKIFCFWIVGDFLDVLEQVMYVLGLGQFLENSFLIRFKDLLLVLYHLTVLVVMVAEDIVNFLDSQSPVNSLNVLKLIRDEVVFI